MKLRWTALIAVAALAFTGTALAEGTGENAGGSAKNASKLCKSLKAQMGAEAFKTAYGTNHNRRNAHGKCVSKHRRAVKALIAEALAQCKAELQAGQSLRVKPAQGDNADKQALRECVKQKLAALLAERREAFDNAAEACKAERKADPAAFREKYGSNENKRNAFGKCVSKTARAELEAQPQPQPQS